MSAPATADAFWRFSLQLWGRPGVQQACLWLQDRCGADVNLLLLCCWLESRGRSADERLLARAIAEVAPWRREVLEPLRRVRRRLGAAALRGVEPASAASVRARTLAAELSAERVEQRLLARSASRRRRDPPRAGNSGASLERYRRLLGVASTPAVERRLAVLCAAAAAKRPSAAAARPRR